MFDLPVPSYQDSFPAGACLAIVAMPAQPQWEPYISYAVNELGVRTLLVKGGTCEEAKRAIRSWRKLSAAQMLMIVDGEYGTAMRFDDGRREPSARALGQKPVQETEAAYQRIGVDLDELGIDINLAPVADVWLNERSAFLQPRCFGSTPEEVSLHVRAAVRGLHHAQVGACLKHFPGHGGASADSHKELPIDPVQMQTWRDLHRRPFEEGLLESPEMVMIAHLQMPGLDPSGIPTSFSSHVIQKLLREELQYEGVVITDALNMQAILGRWDPPEACIQALKAGSDLCLLCEDDLGPELYTHWLPRITQEIESALSSGILPRQQWLQSCHRVQALIQARAASGTGEGSSRFCQREEARDESRGLCEAIQRAQGLPVRNFVQSDKIGEKPEAPC